MIILQVVASMNPYFGGISQGIRNLIPALEDIGIHNEVVCMDDPNSDYLGLDTFPIHPLGPSGILWAYSFKFKSWLKSNLSRFDAVIVNGLWLYPGFAVYKANEQIKGKRPKIFVMPHGMLDPYFQHSESRMLKALRNWFYWKLIERKLIHSADGILFTCEQEMILARETFRPYHPKKELNIGYGIPEPPPYTEEMSAKFLELCPKIKRKNYLLFLSRIHQKKGVDLLIEAYLQLKEQRYNKELPLLVIAGPGIDTTYGKQLKQLVDQNPMLSDAVFFPGMLTGAAKWGAFYGAKAFILPSHQENFGIAVVEALACGKPVLISNQVNIYREIQEMNGGIVGPDTLVGTLNLLKCWIGFTPEEKQEMGNQAKSCFHNKFAIAPNALRFKNAIIQ
ncbi:glycosyltransferase [Cyclobacterium jeungdonense]|uniref:Glycosyltransferase n=1 Tax=Cyclobacterium jeungdonense TaxID=708087 RepID=A0ABT8C8L2_9BACT|nr:glycosyltransferase [Cyclobacterium jeungdonense]MDN3688865.1 glycosyltransferase [Cyclobacterium jeungdonense]